MHTFEKGRIPSRKDATPCARSVEGAKVSDLAPAEGPELGERDRRKLGLLQADDTTFAAEQKSFDRRTLGLIVEPSHVPRQEFKVLFLAIGRGARAHGPVEKSLYNLPPSSLAIFFPSWLSRESAIGRSPLRLGEVSYSFSIWAEEGEEERGHLRHMAWIRLINWPILCWSEEEVKAAVSGFGELWEVDDRSSGLLDVSCFRVRVRCRDVMCIPEVLSLTVEDRRFCISIAVDSWEETVPILLGEAANLRLGLTSPEAQEGFINSTGFPPLPGAGLRGPNPTFAHPGRGSSGGNQRAPASGGRGPDRQPPRALSCSNSNSPPTRHPPPPPYAGSTLPPPARSSVSVVSAATAGQLEPPPAPPSPLGSGGVNTLPPLAAHQPALPTWPIGAHSSAPTGQQAGLGPGPLFLPGNANSGAPGASDANGSALPGPTGSSFQAPKSFISHRRSVRLAAKYKGAKKSSLTRAQDLMCKKLKWVRFAAKAARSASSTSVAPPSVDATTLPRISPALQSLGPPPKAPGTDEASSAHPDLRTPLSQNIDIEG